MTRLFFALLVVVTVIVSCQSFRKRDGSWSGQMQNMSQDIKLLIPYAYDKKAYLDPKNEAVITNALKDLTVQSHKVPEEMGKKFLGDDPIISHSLDHLQSDLQRALSSFSQGQKEYSRSVLKSSMGYCFQCHSLTKIGAEARWDLSDFKNLELTPEEKLDLLVAARKYKEAFEFAEKVISEPGLIKNQPMMFESLLRKHLALSLRISGNPSDTLKDLDRIVKDRELPPYLQKQVKAWRDSLEGWRSVKKNGRKRFIKLAEERIAKGRRLQEYAYDHAGDVEYIWATDILHRGLRRSPTQETEAKAYYLLGVSYEVLDDLGSYGLHETYYEACIHKYPRSKLAKRCYDRLQASLVQGFSGSAGLSLPADERQRLNHLKDLL